jgi:hypothetical protein
LLFIPEPRSLEDVTTRAVLIAVCAVALAAACKPVVDVANPSPFEEDDPAAQWTEREIEQAQPESVAAPDEAPVAGPGSGTVLRTQVDAVLDAGLGAMLEGVEIDPKLDLRNRFVGWVVVRFPYTWADVREGDVVSTVNGYPLGKPHEVQKLWDSLRDAPSIVVRGERNETPFELKFDVVDDEPRTAGP